jgi:DNA-binding transcriptional LysR family regulator
MSDLIGEQLDVAVRLGRPRATSLVGSKLCDMPRVVVASPDYLARQGLPKRPRDLTRLPCWSFPFEGHDASWRFRDARGRTGTLPVKVRGVAADGFVLRRIALEGGGFTVLPRFLVAEDLRSGRLVDPFPTFDVTPTVFDTALWLLYPSKELPLRTRVFVDYAKEQFRGEPPWEKRGEAE